MTRLTENEFEEAVVAFKERVKAGEDKHAVTEEFVAMGKRHSGRECGACSMCCKILDIKDGDFNKPGDRWCQHCDIGKGCKIYEKRPGACRSFSCLWLTNPMIDEMWWPARSKIVIAGADVDAPTDSVTFNVDPAFPMRWRQEPYYSEIRRFATGGLNTPNQFFTYVQVGMRTILVLPKKEVDVTGSRKHGVTRSGMDWEVTFG